MSDVILLLTEIRDLLKEIKENTRRKTPPPKENTTKQLSPKWRSCQFVRLTDDEYDKLVLRYGRIDTDKLIAQADNYVGSTGKAYKDYYLTIINWAGRAKIPETYEFRQLKTENPPNESGAVIV